MIRSCCLPFLFSVGIEKKCYFCDVNFYLFVMLKSLITPCESTYTLSIPAQYIGKEVEVSLYPTGKVSENKNPNNKKPSDFFGSLTVAEGEKFQKHVANSRLEWDRSH